MSGSRDTISGSRDRDRNLVIGCQDIEIGCRDLYAILIHNAFVCKYIIFSTYHASDSVYCAKKEAHGP